MSLLVSQLRLKIVHWVVIVSLALAACQSAPVSSVPPSPAKQTAVEATPSAAPSATAPVNTAAPPPTTAPPAPEAWLPPYLPDGLREELNLPKGVAVAKDQAAPLRVDAITGADAAPGAVEWVYALVAPFATVTDEVQLADLRALWQGSPPEDFPFQTLLLDSSTAGVFERLWGVPGARVKLVSVRQRLEQAWKTPGALSILPFEELEPRWKVLAVDGLSPVRKDFNAKDYGLTVRFGLLGEEPLLQTLSTGEPLAESNRQANRLTTVVLTGVTALVRGTGAYMERYGNTYPASEIGPWLREADILHINNEVPFARTCPEPYNWEGLVFCSRTKYIELLEDVGTDVVELAGDHFQDWGKESMLYTLDLYKERGWQYYGGGANAEEARQAARFEHNGNRIAFIGCNAKPPGYATASETNPGAIHCNFDQMTADVRKLRQEGYLPIVTFQHLEYYSYEAHPILVEDFNRMAEAGAVIVSGSQAHQPHAIAFEEDSFLHYGLGNLFFDQTNQGDAPRTSFIDRHVFYNGKHISTELLTIYLVNYALQRPMTPEEREALLRVIYDASGWETVD